MDPVKVILVYVITLVGFLVIDFIWLSLTNSRLYKPGIGHLMAESPNLIPALIFYLVYVVGVLVLAVFPGIDAGSLGKAVLFGAILGFVAYGTYDFTNFATLKDWPLHIVLIDVVWGTTVTSLTAVIGYFAGTAILN